MCVNPICNSPFCYFPLKAQLGRRMNHPLNMLLKLYPILCPRPHPPNRNQKIWQLNAHLLGDFSKFAKCHPQTSWKKGWWNQHVQPLGWSSMPPKDIANCSTRHRKCDGKSPARPVKTMDRKSIHNLVTWTWTMKPWLANDRILIKA